MQKSKLRRRRKRKIYACKCGFNTRLKWCFKQHMGIYTKRKFHRKVRYVDPKKKRLKKVSIPKWCLNKMPKNMSTKRRKVRFIPAYRNKICVVFIDILGGWKVFWKHSFIPAHKTQLYEIPHIEGIKNIDTKI